MSGFFDRINNNIIYDLPNNLQTHSKILTDCYNNFLNINDSHSVDSQLNLYTSIENKKNFINDFGNKLKLNKNSKKIFFNIVH